MTRCARCSPACLDLGASHRRAATIQLRTTPTGRWLWRLRAASGNLLAVSPHTYRDRGHALRAARSLLAALDARAPVRRQGEGRL